MSRLLYSFLNQLPKVEVFIYTIKISTRSATLQPTCQCISALKGQYMSALGNALGIMRLNNSALKGQKNQSDNTYRSSYSILYNRKNAKYSSLKLCFLWCSA